MTHNTDYICMDWVRGIAKAHASLMLPDLNTHAHHVMITQLAIPFALRLGFSAHDTDVISLGCEVHDIGKLAILPELIANRLIILKRDSTVFERIKKHTEYGAQFFNALRETIGYENFFKQIIEMCQFHHEYWNGNGYYGLKGDTIPRMARLVAILDAFTAMTEPLRAYRVALTQAQAIDEMRACAGTQFDPNMISVLLDILHSPAGSLPPVKA